MTVTAVDIYIRALTDLRTLIAAHRPAHQKVISYPMPGFRQPGPKGKMVAGYAAFNPHRSLYPHSGNTIPRIDGRPFPTSKSGVLFTPENPLPAALILQIITLRRAQLAAKA